MTGLSSSACAQCGLPLRTPARFCCLGCEIADAIGGERDGRTDRGAAGPLLARMGLAAFLSMNVMMLAFALWGATPRAGRVVPWVSLLRWLSLLLALPAMGLLVPPLLRSGFARLSARALRVELLVVVAAVAAFAVSAVNTVRERGEVWFDTATMVLLVVTLGSYLSARARSRARDDVRRLFAYQAGRYVARRGDVDLELGETEIARGDRLRLAKGARVPVDGTVMDASGAELDTALLTGEPLPRCVGPGDRVRAGELLHEGTLDLRADQIAADSTLGRMRATLERALARPPELVRAVDRAAQMLVATTGLLALALLLFFAIRGDPATGLTRSLALLAVACPCSIGLAAPITLTRALGDAARLGAVVQSLDALEQLGRVDCIAADKTGTLTTGDAAALLLVVTPQADATEEEVRALAFALAQGSAHPMAMALRAGAMALRTAVAPAMPAIPAVTGLHEVPGCGIEARDDRGRQVRLGRREWAVTGVRDRGVAAPEVVRGDAGNRLSSMLARDGRPLATLELEEVARPGAAGLGLRLKQLGIDLIVLSGDAESRTLRLATQVGGAGRGDLLPDEKAQALAALRRVGARVAWLGDGANDAVALAAADVSIAVDRRLEWLADAADLVLLGDRIAVLPDLVLLARRARRRIIACLAWAGVYHVVALTLGATGLLTPATAALLMAAGSIAVVHWSLRPLAAGPDPENSESVPPRARPQSLVPLPGVVTP